MGIEIFKTVSNKLFRRSAKPKQYPSGGIRIVHEKHKSCVVAVEVPGKPFGFKRGLPIEGYEYKVCPTCNVPHQVKTLHLWLDSEGGTVISHGVLDELQQAGMPGFAIESEVAEPPKQTLAFNKGGQLEVVRERPRMVTYGHG